MSSPVMPNPVMSPLPPMPPRRRRSFAGPFVLIVLGVVFPIYVNASAAVMTNHATCCRGVA